MIASTMSGASSAQKSKSPSGRQPSRYRAYSGPDGACEPVDNSRRTAGRKVLQKLQCATISNEPRTSQCESVGAIAICQTKQERGHGIGQDMFVTTAKVSAYHLVRRSQRKNAEREDAEPPGRTENTLPGFPILHGIYTFAAMSDAAQGVEG
jgi:hypothetical protein